MITHLPMTMRVWRALVMATLILFGLATNPIPSLALARTHDKIIMSFSLFWEESVPEVKKSSENAKPTFLGSHQLC